MEEALKHIEAAIETQAAKVALDARTVVQDVSRAASEDMEPFVERMELLVGLHDRVRNLYVADGITTDPPTPKPDTAAPAATPQAAGTETHMPDGKHAKRSDLAHQWAALHWRFAKWRYRLQKNRPEVWDLMLFGAGAAMGLVAAADVAIVRRGRRDV